MSFLDHIQTCNTHDLSRFIPFCAPDGDQVGWIREDNVTHLQDYDDVLEIQSDRVALKNAEDLSAAMAIVTKGLQEKGVISGWREELYKVADSFSAKPKFFIERAATPFFGIRAFGVHLNVFVRSQEGLKMWIGKRALDRAVCPGKLDNAVAGGQPGHLSLMENVIKECGEEANIPPKLAQKAVPVGTVQYTMETDGGIKPDVMFCYDLEVPEDFACVNTDGETAEFYLLPINEVADIVKSTQEFKFNCNLVVIDFLIRHGIINPDNEPDYEALVKGLRA